MSQLGKQTISIQKFGQLIQYQMRNVFFFLKNHTLNGVENLFPEPFLNNQN